MRDNVYYVNSKKHTEGNREPAAVVGVLGAAMHDPVWTIAIHSRTDAGLALAAFGLLVYARISPVVVVALAAAAGWFMGA